jgi:hypothetical protein
LRKAPLLAKLAKLAKPLVNKPLVKRILEVLLLLRERLVLLRVGLLHLRLSLQHHALAHFLGDLMMQQWLKRRLRMVLLTQAMRLIRAIPPGVSDFSPAVDIPSDVLKLALEIIDARLELSDLRRRGVARSLPPCDRHYC